MTSIKKYIDGYEGELLGAITRAYSQALISASTSADRAVPGVDYPLRGNLSRIQDQLMADPKPETCLGTQQAVDTEFRRWSESVELHLRSKASEAREITLTMVNAAKTLGNRDQRYVRRFGDMMAQLRKIADLDDLSEVRKAIMARASELDADVLSMEAEGQGTIKSLEIQLEAYRRQLAEAEQRGRLDAVTGLMNRRGIELEMAVRSEARVPFCVVMLDLNSFKSVNDTYGHLAGDDLLRQFCQELQTHCRPTDLIGRWGGDEFITLLNGDRIKANDYADRVRKWAFGTYKVKTARGVCRIEVAASIGIAVWDLQEDLAHLLARADESMYEHKRSRA